MPTHEPALYVGVIGFGLDSFVEVSSAAVLIWQPEDRERFPLRLIGASFLALAALVTFDAARSLLAGGDADASPVGTGLAVASLIVMPLLMRAKRRTGGKLGSATVMADPTQPMLCTYLSPVLLVGLVLNAVWGWSWADPLAALVIAGVAVKEGVEAWRGERCDGCAPLPAVDAAIGQGPGCTDGCCTEQA